MSGSASFVRRVAPAVLIGTAAVAVVGLFDPALGRESDPAPLAAGPSSQESASGRAGEASERPTVEASPTAEPQPDPTSQAGGQAASGCDNATEIVGDSIDTRWGPVQVAATVADGALCQVYAVDFPYGDDHSARISDQVIPYLDEVATQLGTEFDSVSGATYTCEGYRDSLQSIVDQL